jgi:Protein of unknown function (DUF3224)
VRRSVAGTLVVLSTIGVTHAASSVGATVGHSEQREVTFVLSGPPVQPQAPACSADCPFPFSQRADATGGLTGTVVGSGAVRLAGSRFAGASTFVFRGTVERCGTGTLVLRRYESGNLDARRLRGTWDIAPEAGSDDLEHASGAGTITAEAADAPGTISSRFTGRIACAPATPTSRTHTRRQAGERVRFRATNSTQALGTPVCDAGGACVVPSTWQEPYVGGIEGAGNAAGAAVVRPTTDGFAYVSTGVKIVSGTVSRCGSGSVLVRTRSDFDGTDLTQQWEIVPGFGADALERTSGAGTAAGERDAAGVYDAIGRGRIVCG